MSILASHTTAARRHADLRVEQPEIPERGGSHHSRNDAARRQQARRARRLPAHSIPSQKALHAKARLNEHTEWIKLCIRCGVHRPRRCVARRSGRIHLLRRSMRWRGGGCGRRHARPSDPTARRQLAGTSYLHGRPGCSHGACHGTACGSLAHLRTRARVVLQLGGGVRRAAGCRQRLVQLRFQPRIDLSSSSHAYSSWCVALCMSCIPHCGATSIVGWRRDTSSLSRQSRARGSTPLSSPAVCADIVSYV